MIRLGMNTVQQPVCIFVVFYLCFAQSTAEYSASCPAACHSLPTYTLHVSRPPLCCHTTPTPPRPDQKPAQVQPAHHSDGLQVDTGDVTPFSP